MMDLYLCHGGNRGGNFPLQTDRKGLSGALCLPYKHGCTLPGVSTTEGTCLFPAFLMSTKWGIKQNLQVGAKSPVSVIPGHASPYSGFGNLLDTLSVFTLFDLQHLISLYPVSDIGSQCSPSASLWVSRPLIILKLLPWWLWKSLTLVVYVMFAFYWGEREALSNFFHPPWNSSSSALTSFYVPFLASFYCLTSLFYALVLATRHVGS